MSVVDNVRHSREFAHGLIAQSHDPAASIDNRFHRQEVVTDVGISLCLMIAIPFTMIARFTGVNTDEPRIRRDTHRLETFASPARDVGGTFKQLRFAKFSPAVLNGS